LGVPQSTSGKTPLDQGAIDPGAGLGVDDEERAGARQAEHVIRMVPRELPDRSRLEASTTANAA